MDKSDLNVWFIMNARTQTMTMIRWICGVSLRDKHTSAELRSWLSVKAVAEVCRRNRLRWFGHVERKVDDDWVRCTLMEVDGRRSRGRPRKMRRTVIKDDLKRYDLHAEDMMDLCVWREREFMVRTGQHW
jgi:hypothetical protein